jgi:hypothetical protein
MSVPLPSSFATQEDLFKQVIDTQFSKSISEIQNLMDYDVAFRLGNPTQYKRRETDSYLSYILGTGNVIDPIPFEAYVANSLPTPGGTTTLAQSQIANPAAWEALQLNVGFSTSSLMEMGGHISQIFSLITILHSLSKMLNY